MGFSLAGLVVSLAILAPTLLLRGAPAPPPPAVPAVLTGLERAGQAGCLVLPALTGDPTGRGWLVVVLAAVLGYYALWARYLYGGRRLALLYAPLGPIPVPMAVLPVLAFLAAALWLASWPVAVAVAVLAVGHLPTSWLVARGLSAG